MNPYSQSSIDLDCALPHLRHARQRVSFLRPSTGRDAIATALDYAEALLTETQTMLDRAAAGKAYTTPDAGNCMTCSEPLVSKLGMVACFGCGWIDTPAEFEERQDGWRDAYAEAARDWADSHREAA